MTSTIRRPAILRSRHGLRWLAGGIVLLGLTVVIAYQARPAATVADERWLYVQPQTLENHLGLVGRIEAAMQTTLAAPFEGLVQDMKVAEGQRVERGQHLLTLDTTQLDIQLRDALSAQLKAESTVQEMQDWPQSEGVARARRAVTSAQLGLSDTEAKLADTRRLLERGIVARMEVDTLEQQQRTQQIDLAASQAELRAALDRGKGVNRRIAEMELENAQARYQTLQAQHMQRELHAPFAGIVLRPRRQEGGGSVPLLQQGMRAIQGMPLFELTSLERIKAVTRVEEADLHQLSEGMQVQITGDGFEGTSLQGRIEAIGVQGTPSDYGAGITYAVTVAIDPLLPAQLQRVRLGMSARLAIVTYRAENGLALPAEALHQGSEGSTFVIHRKAMDGTSRQVTVTPGRAVPQGIEVFGLEPGYVQLPAIRP